MDQLLRTRDRQPEPEISQSMLEGLEKDLLREKSKQVQQPMSTYSAVEPMKLSATEPDVSSKNMLIIASV